MEFENEIFESKNLDLEKNTAFNNNIKMRNDEKKCYKC